MTGRCVRTRHVRCIRIRHGRCVRTPHGRCVRTSSVISSTVAALFFFGVFQPTANKSILYFALGFGLRHHSSFCDF